jgi:hypothetical protein
MKFSSDVMPLNGGDLDAIAFKAGAATIPKWRIFEVLRCMKNMYWST